MFRPSGYPDRWLAAGDDRDELVALARQRRRFDAQQPPKILRRRWNHSEHPFGQHAIHLLSSKEAPGPTDGRPLLLYLHGGGYVFGPTAIEWLTVARIARLVGADLAVWDYPKAPEWTADQTVPATRDAWDALADRYGAENIAIVGLAAGAGLAMSLLLHRRGLGLAQPAGAILCSPWLDLTLSHPDIPSLANGDVVLPVSGLRRDGELYAGSFALDHPLVSPRFSEFHGLPPLYFIVGEHEILLPDAREVVEAISTAGGAARLDVEPRGQHAGVILPTPEGTRARRQMVAFVGRVLRPGDL